jgi:hypothetical protein
MLAPTRQAIRHSDTFRVVSLAALVFVAVEAAALVDDVALLLGIVEEEDEDEAEPLPALPTTAEPSQSPLVPLLSALVTCTMSEDANTEDPAMACACT